MCSRITIVSISLSLSLSLLMTGYWNGFNGSFLFTSIGDGEQFSSLPNSVFIFLSTFRISSGCTICYNARSIRFGRGTAYTNCLSGVLRFCSLTIVFVLFIIQIMKELGYSHRAASLAGFFTLLG